MGDICSRILPMRACDSSTARAASTSMGSGMRGDVGWVSVSTVVA